MSNKLVYVTDRLFLLDKLELISTAWVASVDEIVLVEGDFILLVLIEYIYLFVAEICRVLTIMKVVDHVLTRSPNTVLEIEIIIRSDCQSVLDDLWNTSPIVT